MTVSVMRIDFKLWLSFEYWLASKIGQLKARLYLKTLVILLTIFDIFLTTVDELYRVFRLLLFINFRVSLICPNNYINCCLEVKRCFLFLGRLLLIASLA
jgi:hypothetical protein